MVSRSLICPVISVGLTKEYALLDTGASIHCTNLLDQLSNVQPCPPLVIHLADDRKITVNRWGEMSIPMSMTHITTSKKYVLHLRNVYYHPKINTLISPGLLAASGFRFEYDSKGCKIYKKTLLISKIPVKDNLYIISLNSRKSFVSNKTPCVLDRVKTSLTLFDLHKIYGHLNYDYLVRLIKNRTDLPFSISKWEKKQCPLCSKANIKKVPLPAQRRSQLAEAFGDHIHMAIWGAASTAAIGGYIYVLTLVYDCTRWCTMRPMKHKN